MGARLLDPADSGRLSRVADRPDSLTSAFAAALDDLPHHWPRTHWLREKVAADTVDFRNGDFRLRFHKIADTWRLAETEDARTATRQYWWLWLVAGLLVAAGMLVVAVAADNAWWLGGTVGLLAAMARMLFSQSRTWRRRGSRIPTGSQ